MAPQKSVAIRPWPLLTLLCLAAAFHVAPSHSAAVARRALTRYYYYARGCPQAERIVQQRLHSLARNNSRLAPQLIRLHFHDCFVRGCDASILLDGLDENPSEKGATPNLSVGGYEAIDDIKAALEKACPATVSCADVITMASKYALMLVGGPRVPMKMGRLDGVQSTSGGVAAMIPDTNGNFSGNLAIFKRVGLNLVDMVALSGVHTVGRGRCQRVEGRIKFPDVTLSKPYRSILLSQCGSAATFKPSLMINMDHVTPLLFDNQYYKNLIAKAGMFASDQILLLDRRSRALVFEYATDEAAFFSQFSHSMVKMSEIGLITPEEGGEVRTKCNLPRQLSQ